jgi:gliding motility-associated-like protein
VDTVIGTSYTDQNLNTYNEDYYYKVKTIDSCRNISDSFSTVHRTINLDAEGGNEVNILTWNSYEGQPVERYRILRGGTELYTVDGNTTRFRDEQVICDSFYNYEIKAVLDSGYEAFSNVDSAKSFDTKAPESVYLRRATVDRFNDVVELKWDKSVNYDAASYEIYRNILDESGTEKIATVEGKQQTTYYDTIELADEEVCYEVRVLDRCDNASGFSNRGCIIRPEVEALDLKNQIVWPTYQIWRSGVRDYEVFKQVDSAKYRSIGRTDSSKRTFTDEELSDTADEFCYYIRVRGWKTEEYSRSTKICIEQPAVVHIPNSFSPGITPGVNDAFGPVGLYIENYTLKIYNRWGEEVFSTSDGEKWDGTYEGELVPTGVYTYTIVIFGKDGSTEEFRGTVNVIR